ncbi:MAG TPA: STAS domain-containing protein [Solirubrobacterales bacterium]
MSPSPFDARFEELEGGIRTFTVCGELDMNTAPELAQLLEENVSGPEGAVMLDLTQCEFIDSTGIALIVRTWQQVDRDAGGEGSGRMVICCSNHQVLRLLKITGVDSSISLYDGREAALAALRD